MASRTEVMSLDHDDDIDVNDPAAAADFPAPSLVTLSRDDADRMLAQDLKFLESCAEKAAAAGAPADAAAASAFASCLDHRDVPMTERVSWLYWHAHKPQWFHLRNFSSLSRTKRKGVRSTSFFVLASKCWWTLCVTLEDGADSKNNNNKPLLAAGPEQRGPQGPQVRFSLQKDQRFRLSSTAPVVMDLKMDMNLIPTAAAVARSTNPHNGGYHDQRDTLANTITEDMQLTLEPGSFSWLTQPSVVDIKQRHLRSDDSLLICVALNDAKAVKQQRAAHGGPGCKHHKPETLADQQDDEDESDDDDDGWQQDQDQPHVTKTVAARLARSRKKMAQRERKQWKLQRQKLQQMQTAGGTQQQAQQAQQPPRATTVQSDQSCGAAAATSAAAAVATSNNNNDLEQLIAAFDKSSERNRNARSDALTSRRFACFEARDLSAPSSSRTAATTLEKRATDQEVKSKTSSRHNNRRVRAQLPLEQPKAAAVVVSASGSTAAGASSYAAAAAASTGRVPTPRAGGNVVAPTAVVDESRQCPLLIPLDDGDDGSETSSSSSSCPSSIVSLSSTVQPDDLSSWETTLTPVVAQQADVLCTPHLCDRAAAMQGLIDMQCKQIEQLRQQLSEAMLQLQFFKRQASMSSIMSGAPASRVAAFGVLSYSPSELSSSFGQQ